MEREIPRVADAELAVLRVLWRKQPLSAREVTEILYKETTSSEIGTVQSLLKRLEVKGLLHRDRSQYTHRFTTTLSRAEFAGRQLEYMADKLTDGSLAPFIMQLVKGKRLSKKEKDAIRKLLNE